SLARYRSVLIRILDQLERDPDERFVLDGVPQLAAVLAGERDDPAMEYGGLYHRLYAAGLRWGHWGTRRRHEPIGLRRRLREAVARGQLELVGTFTQPDTNLPAGEALLRQGLVARAWYRKHLGGEPTVAWNLDSFGQSAQLPQILRQCGYDALLAFRVAPTEDPGVSAAPAGLGGSFLFRGLDGTELPTHALPEGYSPGVVRVPVALSWWSAGTRLVEAARRLSDEAGPLPVLLPFGAEYAAPLPGIGRLRRRLRTALPDRAARLGSARGFFDELARRRGQLPVHDGDLNPVFPGTHALRPELKRADRVTTSAVLAAETLDALLATVVGDVDRERRQAVADAWVPLLTNHAHDSIGGCHAAAVTGDVVARYREADRLARESMDRGFESLVRTGPGKTRPDKPTGRPSAVAPGDRTPGARTPGSGAPVGPVVVFNPLGWERTDVVRVPSSRAGEVRAIRVTVPAFGYAVLDVPEDDGGQGRDEIRVDTDVLTAGETTVRLLSGGRAELRAGGSPVARLDRILLEEDRGNAYLSEPGGALAMMKGQRWQVTDGPPGRRAVCEGQLAGAPLRLELRQIPGRDWIGLAVEGPPVAAGRRLRLPIRRLTGGSTPYEVPFGEMDRHGPAAVQGYIRLAGAAGVANLGCPAHEIGPTTVDLVLLRSIRLLSQRRPLLRLRIPIGATVDRAWRADLALAADARRAARELTRPLVGWQAPHPRSGAAAEAPAHSASLLPPLDGPDTVEVTAIKTDGDGSLVVRLLQMGDRPAAAWFTPPGRGRVERTDAREGPGKVLRRRNGRVKVALDPWELVTLRWTPAQSRARRYAVEMPTMTDV
ncbi:MAG: hypothetical protein QGH45_22370, partial [Myxococcota bacterium]|nr:hypothetical protein [Myxococcota bacterium]